MEGSMKRSCLLDSRQRRESYCSLGASACYGHAWVLEVTDVSIARPPFGIPSAWSKSGSSVPRDLERRGQVLVILLTTQPHSVVMLSSLAHLVGLVGRGAGETVPVENIEPRSISAHDPGICRLVGLAPSMGDFPARSGRTVLDVSRSSPTWCALHAESEREGKKSQAMLTMQGLMGSRGKDARSPG